MVGKFKMKFIVLLVVGIIVFWLYDSFSTKSRINSAINSESKINKCGTFLGLKSTNSRFKEDYFAFKNNENKVDAFNIFPQFDLHNKIKNNEIIKNGDKVCFLYAYVHTYMDSIKIITNVEKIK
ncbi:hypothetical protein F981_04057 [Acinetobacter guillouiae CIP 63.46]|nr:hypothetical protein F981_04057 [Acinetobacter guillouiae CIP 63.46]